MPKLRRSPILLVMNIALVVYGLTALFSIFTAYDTTLSEATIAAIALSIVIYFAVVSQLRGIDSTPLFAKLAGLVGLVFGLFFISQFGHQQYNETPDIINQIGNLTTFLPSFGVFIHQNSAATLIELLLPIVVALLFMSTKQNRRILWGGTLVVLIYAFVLTFSRGAFLGLGIAFLIGLGAIGTKRLSGRQAVALIAGIVVVIAALVVGLVVLGPRLPFISSLAGITSSRLEIYRNSLGLAGDYIFTGIGLGGTFAMVYSRYALMIFVPQFTYTHNLFLAVLLGQGIIGLVAFLMVIITFYMFVVRVLTVVQIAKIDPIFYGALIGVTATFIHGLTDARQYVESPFNLPLLFVGIGLTVASGISALRAEAYENRETNRGGGWRTLMVIAGVAVTLLVIGVVIFNKPILAAWHTNLGALAEARSDINILPNVSSEERADNMRIAREEYQLALQIDPDYTNVNRRLGNLNVDGMAFKEAVPLLEKAYATTPNYPASIKGLGLAYTWVGRAQEAACTFKKLTDVAGMNNELYTWQDFRHSQDQDLLSAYALEAAAYLEDFKQTNMDVWVLTGDRYQAAGQPKKAQEWYSRVLEKDANNSTAMDRLKALGLPKIAVTSETVCT